ncbi:MAG: NAD(P)H-hydrate dehydratase [Chlamydiae bacterium]|nr:NAD(P)H-hydrate dehydratase [Chlamydiota bacterium]
MEDKALLKVVTSEEMSRIEKIAFSQGFSDLQFMENAGESIAKYVLDFLKTNPEFDRVVVFAGKGNNGGDAFVTARILSLKGILVDIVHPYLEQECSSLCKIQKQNLLSTCPNIQFFSLSSLEIKEKDLILDGLVGTGFKGAAKEVLLEAIQIINSSDATVLSIDIPSGLCGTTGVVETEAVKACITLYLELPKWGFFINQGWNFVGSLVRVLFGLDEKHISTASAQALLAMEDGMKNRLPAVDRCWHKYQRGYVLGFAGSTLMQGAAVLSSSAALRSGAGIVRLFYPEDALTAMPVEVIQEPYSLSKFLLEMSRASSCFIGPGLGRNDAIFEELRALVANIKIPCVIDADGLYYIANNPGDPVPQKTILTPHHGEMYSLLQSSYERSMDGCLLSSTRKYVESKKVVVVLKGAPTFIFSPDQIPVIMTFGDPGMATAGSGDVLTGIISSLLAQKLALLDAAILGVYLHSKAGEISALEKTSFCILASDIVSNLPKAFELLLQCD